MQFEKVSLLELSSVVTGFWSHWRCVCDEKALRWRASLVTVCQVNNRGKLCVSATAKHLCAPLEFPRGESIKFYKERVQNRAQLAHTHSISTGLVILFGLESSHRSFTCSVATSKCQAPTIKHGFRGRIRRRMLLQKIFQIERIMMWRF